VYTDHKGQATPLQLGIPAEEVRLKASKTKGMSVGWFKRADLQQMLPSRRPHIRTATGSPPVPLLLKRAKVPLNSYEDAMVRSTERHEGKPNPCKEQEALFSDPLHAYFI